MTVGEESVDDANLLARLRRLYEEVDSPPEGLIDHMTVVTFLAASGRLPQGSHPGLMDHAFPHQRPASSRGHRARRIIGSSAEEEWEVARASTRFSEGSVLKFSLERQYKILGAVGQIAALVISVAAGAFVSATSWWAGLILFGIAAIAGWTLIRVPRISVQYDIDALTVVGVLWSRRIPRHSITAVDRDPDNPMVWWSTPSGKGRFTPLTPLWNVAYVSLPPRSIEARRQYLTRVAAWLRS